MNLRRFFIDPQQCTGQTARLTGPEAHHLRKVLRLSVGEEICLFDGTGNRLQARIDKITKEAVETTILKKEEDPPAKVRLHLGQSCLKGQKMDLVVQKATELGVESVWPFWSEHGVHRLGHGDKAERWHRIAFEACKQCNRARIPDIAEARGLTELLAAPPEADLKLIFWEKEQKNGLSEVLQDRLALNSVFFLVGPEGGFSEQEYQAACENGFIPVSLGSRILRAETASLTATAILQFLLGNLSVAKG